MLDEYSEELRSAVVAIDTVMTALDLYRAARFDMGMSAERALTFVANIIGVSRDEAGWIIGRQLGQRDRMRP